jgi:hypothetical protein
MHAIGGEEGRRAGGIELAGPDPQARSALMHVVCLSLSVTSTYHVCGLAHTCFQRAIVVPRRVSSAASPRSPRQDWPHGDAVLRQLGDPHMTS